MHNLTDQKLYELCKTYGENALHWRRKFTGLLPEVNRRRLYERKGFSSIFEFAKKLCGLSEEQVRRVLNLNERFKDKPVLHKALIDGEVSANKLARIASVATPENEIFWIEKSKQLPNRALETLVKDSKIENGLFEPKNEEKSVRAHRLQLDNEVEEELMELQVKGIDINRELREFLEERKRKLAQEKAELASESEMMAARQKTGHATPARYIPVKIRRHLHKEHGSKCSIEHCAKPATTIHHTQRFALSATHNPRYLAPLCHEHHAIAHAIDAKVQVKRGVS